MQQNPGAKRAVLVAGDSFVDENWLTSPFDAYHAYNVGHDYYISNVPDADSRVLSLCGAASVWRILNGQPEGGSDLPRPLHDECNLLGLSAWNPRDHDRLLCLLCPIGDEEKRANPYTLTGLLGREGSQLCPYTQQSCDTPPRFVNLIDENADEAKTHTSTNRIIRVYTGFGGDQPCLEHRYDWRLKIARGHKDEYRSVVKEIREQTQTEDLEAIVVVDHGYGVMDDGLAKVLHKSFPGAKWYVRCKVDTATWVKELREANVRLAFTDEQLMKYKYGTRTWMRGRRVIGRGALEALGDLLGLQTYRNTKEIPAKERHALDAANAALLLENDTAIVATKMESRDRPDAEIATIARPPGSPQSIHVGRSTVFFTSLVYWDLAMPGGLNQDSIGAAARWALLNEYKWTKKCTEAWLQAAPNRLSGPFDRAIYSLSTDLGTNGVEVGSLRYNHEWKQWNDSSRNLGVVSVGRDGGEGQASGSRDSEQQIHIWRAQGAVGDYICPGGEKRDEINDLVKRLGIYQAARTRTYPFNSLFIGEPGWGKSRLARSLASRFDFEYVSFSIAGMASSMDLMNALRAVSSLQNEISRPLLIFVDEIDAKIEGNSPMGLLLEPMWDGNFKTEGIAYRIQPCVWVFASTRPLSLLIQESKGRDFLARVNGPVVELDFFPGGKREEIHRDQEEDARRRLMLRIAREDDRGALRTEMVYHGVNCLNRLFGPISVVDKGVLETFHDVFPINGVRSLEIFVSRFGNVSGGRVSVDNVPSLEDYPELKRHILKFKAWPTKDTGERVRVIINPRG